MQMARELATVVQASYQTPVGSLRHFARFGAVAFGVVAGITAGSKRLGEKEAAFRAAIAERDAKIAQLTTEKLKLEKAVAGESAAKPSSGDPIQDWVDSLTE